MCSLGLAKDCKRASPEIVTARIQRTGDGSHKTGWAVLKFQNSYAVTTGQNPCENRFKEFVNELQKCIVMSPNMWVKISWALRTNTGNRIIIIDIALKVDSAIGSWKSVSLSLALVDFSG